MMQFIETLYADPLLKFLVDTTLKSFVIFAVVGLFGFCLRRRSAAVRGFVWSMAIVGCLIVPLFSFILPKWEVNVLPQAPIRYETYQLAEISQIPVASTQTVVDPSSIAPSEVPTKTEASTQAAPTPFQPRVETRRNDMPGRMPWTNWIRIACGCVSAFLFACLIFGIGAVWYISTRAHDFNGTIDPLPDTWNQKFGVRLSDKITVPMVWGIFRPVILLPIEAGSWQTERLRAVLFHELAHIKRRDWVMQMIAQVVCAVYWFNPLVWFAARWMRIEAEQACDDQVLNAGYQPTDYAQHLLDVVRNVKVASFASRAAVAMVRPSKIEGRLRTVLTQNLNRHPITKVTVGIGLLILICFAVPIGALRLAQAVNPKETLSQQIQEASKSQPTPSEHPSDRTTKAVQVDENVEICKGHLLDLGKAIQAYQKEHGDFPEWLSDLHPQYLSDANTLLCPADEHNGKPNFFINTDPKMPVSYDYQFHPRYQDTKTEERLVYGDVLPLVRCRHHTNQTFECLNLSFAFKIYWSSGVYKPDEMYETTEEAIEALEKGLQRETHNEQFFHVYRTLVHLYIEVGRQKDAEHLINRFKSIIKPDDLSAHFLLGTMLRMANQHEEVLKVFENLEKRQPNNHRVLDELVRIHERLGNAELAEEYRKKADPMSELIGEVVPNFSVTDLDGKHISLQQYRGKVVLLDFWAVWCGPCLTEIPNVKRVYDTYKDQGFDIIGVSLDTDETRLRNYLKKNNISWRQIFSGQKWKSPLAQQYDIRSIPAPWLIARDGTLISREARGVKLEQLVVEALKDKSTNPSGIY
ncbi:MAG: redoxin domain-containing protein [Candidatus Poribacteria bacterium]|nr:redoxin domain-containing protein [Candidatus Poribacteria bacterium]